MRAPLAILLVATAVGVIGGVFAGRALSATSEVVPTPVVELTHRSRAPAVPEPSRSRLRLPPSEDCLPPDPAERRAVLEERYEDLAQELSLVRGFRDREYGTPVSLPSPQFGEPAVSAFFTELAVFGEGQLECVHYPCKAYIPLTNAGDYDALSARIRERYPDAVIQRHNGETDDVAARVQFAGPTSTPEEARRLQTLMNFEMQGL